MTNAEILTKIKAEIDRLYGEYKDKFHQCGDQYHLGLIDGLDMAERVLDSLESEHLADARKTWPKDLEEAADNHIRNVVDTAGHPGWDWTTQDIADAFIAGAKWQKEQHKLVPGKYAEMDFESARNTFSEDVYNHNRKNKTPIDMVDLDDAFETGADWMEKQMMKEVVEKDVHELYTDEEGYHCYVSLGTDYMPGDKVRIIIVKEDKS